MPGSHCLHRGFELISGSTSQLGIEFGSGFTIVAP